MIRAVTTVYLAALAVWVGGIITVGIVTAPVVFAESPSRTVAGDVVGAVLARFDLFLLASLAVILITGAIKTIRDGIRERTAIIRVTGIVVMLAGLTWSLVVVKPQMEALRAEIAGFDTPAGDDARRAEFNELHDDSRQSLSLALLRAVIALYAY